MCVCCASRACRLERMFLPRQGLSRQRSRGSLLHIWALPTELKRQMCSLLCKTLCQQIVDHHFHSTNSLEGKWTVWGLNPGPPACSAGVIPLHQPPLISGAARWGDACVAGLVCSSRQRSAATRSASVLLPCDVLELSSFCQV